MMCLTSSQVTSNIVALAFSSRHFLAVGTIEKKARSRGERDPGGTSEAVGSRLGRAESDVMFLGLFPF